MSDPGQAIPPNGKVRLSPTDRLQGAEAKTEPEPEKSPAVKTKPPIAIRDASVPAVLWDAWKAYSKRAAGYQTGVLFSLMYWVVLGPSASVSRLFGSSLLDLSMKPRATYWLERKPAERTLEALRRQF